MTTAHDLTLTQTIVQQTVIPLENQAREGEWCVQPGNTEMHIHASFVG